MYTLKEYVFYILKDTTVSKNSNIGGINLLFEKKHAISRIKKTIAEKYTVTLIKSCRILTVAKVHLKSFLNAELIK